MSQFTKGSGLPRHVKVLITGPTGVGKTHGGLELPGPTAVWQTEDGLNGFEDRFEFSSSHVDGIKDLIQKMKMVLANKGGDLDNFRTYLVDSVTIPYQEALRAASNSKGSIEFSKQSQFQDDWKELTSLIMKIGSKGKNLWATAHSKHQWEIRNGKPVIVDIKPDMAARLGYAFDIMLYVDIFEGVRIAQVLKSRFPHVMKLGDTIENFSVKTHFAPIFGDDFRTERRIVVPVGQGLSPEPAQAEQKAEQSSVEHENQDSVRAELLSALKALGSKSKGGVVADDLARRALSHSKGEGSLQDARATMAEITALVGGDIRSALIKKLKSLGSVSKGGVVPDDLARRAYAVGNGAEETNDAWDLLGELRKIDSAQAAA